ncbi:MAG: endonuclease [Desulfurococcaceae archaeon]
MSNDMVSVVFINNTCSGYARRDNRVEELLERWFGTPVADGVVLNMLEIAYLLLQKRVRVVMGDKVIDSLDDLVKEKHECLEKFFWPMLAVYKDLRDRGRRVRVLGDMRLIVKDKTGDLKLVIVLEEKMMISPDLLINLVSEAMKNNLSIILAIVSLQGDLTYYEINSITPLVT